MKEKPRRRPPTILRFEDLEGRFAPASLNLLLSRTEPTLIGDTAAGHSYVDDDPAAPGRSYGTDVSADGRYIGFTSLATNLIPGQVDANEAYDVFLHDRVANTTVLVSHASGAPTVAGNGQGIDAKGLVYFTALANGTRPVLSADGRFVAFTSNATDLVAGFSGTAEGPQNVYLYDRLTGINTLVSHQFGSTAIGASDQCDTVNLSAGGGAVIFNSTAVNLVAGFPNPGGGGTSEFIHSYAYDVATGQVTLLDHKFGGSDPAGAAGRASAVTPDGRYVVVESSATDMLGNATATGILNVYRHDRLTGVNDLVSRGSSTVPLGGNGHTSGFAISADGNWVTLISTATNLVPGATMSGNQVFLADVTAGSLRLVTRDAADPLTGGNNASGFHAMSADGRYIVFPSRASNLVAGFVDGNTASGFDAYLYDRLTDQTTLLNHTPGSATMSGNNATGGTLLSFDGQTVVFVDRGTDLVAGFVDRNGFNAHDVYGYDLATGAVTLLSGRNGSPTEGGDGASNYATLSADGKVLAISSEATDLTASVIDTNAYRDVYVKNLTTGKAELASRRFGTPSLSPGGSATWVNQTPDGRFVVFTDTAGNLVPGQVESLPGTQDVFLRDRTTNITILVSRAAGTAATASDNGSGLPVISGDGRFVVYTSYATDLVAGFVDGNGPSATDVFLFDRVTGTTELVSRQVGAPNVGGGGSSGYSNGTEVLGISGDGRWISFASQAGDLMTGFVDNNGTNTFGGNEGADVFLFDRLTGTNVLVNHLPGQPAVTSKNGRSFRASVSSDGSHVAYLTNSTDVVPGMTFGGGSQNVILYDRSTNTHTLVSHAAGSATVGGNNTSSSSPAFSRDGKFLVYGSYSSNLIAGGSDANSGNDIFLFDRLAGTNTLVSHAAGSPLVAASHGSYTGYGQDFSSGRIISADGRYVAFESEAQDLVASFVDSNPAAFRTHVFLFDRVTGANVLVSRSLTSPTHSANQDSRAPTVSGDGRFVAFTSYANDLVSGFSIPTPLTGQAFNAYVFDRLLGTSALVTRDASKAIGGVGGGPGMLTINNDGSVVAYVSSQSNLVAGDLNGFADVIAYVTPPPRVQSVQVADGSSQRSVVRSLTVNFDQPVFFAGDPAAAFVLSGSAGGVQLAAGSVADNSVTLTFSGSQTQFGSLIDGKYTLRALADQISNIGPLDGNNDGVGGDDFTFGFHRLFGDADGNGSVDALDFRAFRAAFGSPSFVFDLDNDGDTDAADFAAFRGRFGGSV